MQVTLSSAQTNETNEQRVVEELVSKLDGGTPKVVFVYASRGRDHKAIRQALRGRLPKETPIVGASTAGELTNHGYAAGSILIGALSGDIDVGVGIGRGLTRDAVRAGASALEQAASQLGVRPTALDPRKHVGVVIDDGFKMKKEELLLGVLENNQGLVIVGGGAADPDVQSAVLYTDTDVIDDAALVVLFSTNTPWAALRAHSYGPIGATVRVTKVDSTARRILELDDRPAALRYAELCGVAPEQLTFANMPTWLRHSLALKVGREYFLRAVWKADEDDSLVGLNMIPVDQQLEIVCSGDIVESTRRFLTEELPRRVPKPTAALFFDCQARRLAATIGGKLDALGDVFKLAPPCVGLNVHLETYCGFQINSTLTALAFGAGQ